MPPNWGLPTLSYRLTNEVTPDDVGKRVMLRYRLTDGRLTDVVGELLSADGLRLRIRRRDGSVRDVTAATVVASKVVPPSR